MKSHSKVVQSFGAYQTEFELSQGEKERWKEARLFIPALCVESLQSSVSVTERLTEVTVEGKVVPWALCSSPPLLLGLPIS